MSARAMWKAVLVFDTQRLPVRLYAAVQDKSIHFRLLHTKDLQPVVQQMVDPATDKLVPKEEIRKGIEVEPGTYVLIDDADLQSVDPEDSREIVIEQVVPRVEVDEQWYDRPYYLGPDGDPAGYFALAKALETSDQIAIARWAMRKKRYVGALHSSDGYLTMNTLRYADEVAPLGDFKPDPGRAPDEREIALAEQLVSALADDFDPDAYQDEYRNKVLQLVESKSAGKILKFPKQEKAPEPDDNLLGSLEASLAAAKKK